MIRAIPFVIALLGGIACLAFLGGRGSNFTTAVVATGFIMAGYLGWILWSQRITRTYDRYADSFYYLGFMLTMAALLIALLAAGPQQEFDLGAILNRFGLGLSTTIVGLAGRIALLEFAGGPEEAVEDALVRVRHGADELANELEMGVRHLREANRATTEFARREREEIGATIKTSVQAVVTGLRALGESLENCKGTLATATTELGAHISSTVTQSVGEAGASARKVLEEVTRTSNAASKEMVGTSERIRTELAKLTVPPDLLREVFTAALTGASVESQKFESELQTLRRVTGQLREALELIHSKAERASNAIADVEGIGKAVGEMTNRITQFGSLAESMHRALVSIATNTTAGASAMTSSSAELRTQLNEHLSSVRQLRTELEQEVRKSVEAVSRVHQSLIENVDFISQKLGR
jgi:hypothetical protein